MGEAIEEEFIVDLVVYLGGRADVDDVAGRLGLPGTEVLRTSGRGAIWLTSLLVAPTQRAAEDHLLRAVLDQLDAGAGTVEAITTSGAALADLYARVDPGADLERLPLVDLVEATLWDRGLGAPRRHRPSAQPLGA